MTSTKDFRVVGPKPQHKLLLDHFTDRANISAVEAAALYRIRSLSRRINDLETEGYLFSRQHSVDPTGQRYVRYHFLGMRKPLNSWDAEGHSKKQIAA